MKEVIIIVGIAPCLKEDMDNLSKYFDVDEADYMIIGIDAIGIIDKPISYLATYHPEEIPAIREKSKDMPPYKLISHEFGRDAQGQPDTTVYPIDIVVPFEQPSGSSAMLGAFAAIQIGYKKIILVGCPLTGKNSAEHPYEEFRRGWECYKDRVLGVVKSCSGWTASFLGNPTKEWIELK